MSGTNRFRIYCRLQDLLKAIMRECYNNELTKIKKYCSDIDDFCLDTLLKFISSCADSSCQECKKF